MQNQRIVGFVIAAIIAATCLYAIGLPESQATEIVPAPQTSRQGGVTITVVPRGFSGKAETWDFDVTLETHTQYLNDDLTRTSILLGDGKPSRPVGWQGSPPGGHHRKGVLRFRAITPPPQLVELQIRRPGEANPAIFRWQAR